MPYLPEASLENLRNRFRQDEDDGPAGAVVNFAQTGQYIGQIISGVLGGDVRPIFAGSVKFVEDQNAASGLTAFLGSIAPALNLALREMYTRTRVALGFASPTTLAPFTVNGTGDGNVTTYGGDEAQEQQIPTTTTAWQYIVKQIQETPTTVEPLPLIKINRPGDEDDDGEFRNVE
ncbi:unnamed protein product [Orchesella dallaii]|uniref:Uncharacterized protein n=1 Tax=Orchesella dallaii TaxID=48710 RepID=A0ABP1PRK3_9HEXA